MAFASAFAGLLFTKKNLFIAAVLILLYAVFGFFIAPTIIKSALLSSITELSGRNASVKEIAVNPFVLSLTIKDFEMSEPDGERFAGFGELYVNFQLSSIFHRAYVFNEFLLIAPEAKAKVLPDGNLNFSDLLSPQEPAKQAPHQDNELPLIMISRLQVENGRLDFNDQSRPIPFETTLFPIGLTLDNFSTRKDNKNPYSLFTTTGEGERLRLEGGFSVNPFRSNGRFELTSIKKRTLWKYIQHQVRFEVTGGSLDLAAQYHMDAGSDAFQVELTNGALKINDLEVAEKGTDHPLISVPSFSVQGFGIDVNNKQVQITSVNSGDARLEAMRDPDGTFNYQSLFKVDGLEDKGVASSEALDHPEIETRPWQISINALTLENYRVMLEDRTSAKPVQVVLEPIDLSVKDLNNQKGSQAEISLRFHADKTGAVDARGLAGIDPVSADLTVSIEKLSLKPFQSYMDAVAMLDITSGTANLDSNIRYKSSGDSGPEMRIKGKGSIEGLKIADRLHPGDFVKLGGLIVNDFEFDVAPYKLSVVEIVAKEPSIRIVIWPDKMINVSKVFSSVQEGDGSSDAGPMKTAKMPITIGTVSIENGSVIFSDLSIKPNVLTGIQGLNGTIKGLTSEPLGRAEVLMEGMIDKYAPVRISGQVNPLSKNIYTNLKLSLKGIELTKATPYFEKFVGYSIEKGKMSLGLDYELSENMLIGENNIFLDQFTFGEPIDSPDATNLPVNLAVALLKDREGIIDMDLPVRGNLNDPEFSYGSIVRKALTNLITNMAASPFAALGNLVGGDGEELSFIMFDFGSAKLPPTQVSKLDKLARALINRPTLRLEIKGSAEARYDRFALAEMELLLQLKKKKYEEMRNAAMPVPAQAQDISLSDDEHDRLLIQAFEDRSGEQVRVLPAEEQKSRVDDGRVAPDSAIALKQRLIERMPIAETALRELAEKRAMQIKDYMVQEGGIPEKQVFTVGIEITDSSDGDHIRTNLTLSGI